MRGTLTVGGPHASFMERQHGAHIMDAVTLIVLVVFFDSIYFAGRVAENRGRSFKVWAWVAALIGPLAFPLIFLLPNLNVVNVSHA
jgi:hypothetical protein